MGERCYGPPEAESEVLCSLSHLTVDLRLHIPQKAHTHLDSGGGTVRITFFDFSSAFYTIQPLLVGEKLMSAGASCVLDH